MPGEEIGTIISGEESPTPEKIDFLIEGMVNQGQFVEIETSESKLIARVSNIKKTNRYYMEAESLSEYSKEGNNIEEVFPTKDWEFLVGEARILGKFSSGRIERCSFPPSPGSEVYLAEKKKLSAFLGLDKDGLEVGNVQFQDLKAKLNLTKLFQKHLAILAQSGAGKSYLSAVLLEELLDRDEEKGKIASVVVDPHGEYAGFAKDEGYMDQVKVFSGKDIQISTPSISANNVDNFFPNLSDAQKRELSKIIGNLKKESEGSGSYSLKKIKKEIEESDIKSNVKGPLIAKINRMSSMRLFGKYDNPGSNEVEQGKMVVLDLSDIIDRKKKQIIVAHFAYKLLRQRRKGNIPPFFMLVEEAHNFIPEGVKQSQAISRGPLTKIAREGRKFHASLGLISQRPAYLSQTALSQCNTQLILRVTNPHDLDRIEKSAEGITSDLKGTIPGLKTGECIIVGEAVNYPVIINVRERNSKEFETGKDMEEVAKEFSEEEKKKDEDMEAFM